ncbi:hypothetical protein [Marinomonas mediterranea]|jgi:hypothetical protein|uniref:Glutaredoxin n=1 Tax=Marinomonas mediterranea (strain ATCC 700492 / JCM 21426 / NBRC 103028 / MMB-1) TaxID=717774 RepID=F2JTU1_MARM1|nr:hypothetical protein [Marinomonas mediterranea]ADZ92711.1 hypothetical protein Marme_3496 [Marinomonas mediterranea MMB-1]WCN10644.1 hypothetical protein GV055_17790 [Marinomonas mediterranea]WCN14701.1 hypothetical protein GV054_17665 [Marinomonas mediterranea]WCN18740.1 hypothetical protein GV053_17690 [Marinomonas mediterranea MMB-1]
MKNYTLYCATLDGTCRLAEDTLSHHNIAFETVSVEASRSSKTSKAELICMIGLELAKVPQLFYGSEYVGNLHDLQRQFTRI